MQTQSTGGMPKSWQKAGTDPQHPAARLSRAVLAQQQEANASGPGHSPARAGFESEIRALTSDLACSYTKGFC